MVLGSDNPVVPIPPVEMVRGLSLVVPQGSGARIHGRGMRPAGGTRLFPQRVKDELTDEGENTRVGPLSVEAKEFSLRTVPRIRVTAGAGSDGGGNCVPSRRRHGEIVRRCDALVPTTAVAGVAALADIAGAAAPVDLAETDVPAAARMKFSAFARCIPRLLMMRVILQSSVLVDSGALLFLILWRPLGRIVAPWMICLFWNR